MADRAGRPGDVKASVQQQFGQVAANYSASEVHARGVDLEKLVHVAALTGAEVVLDAGCGAGHATLALAPFAAQVIAVDLTEPMLEQARQLAAPRRLTNVEFRRGDVERLPFDSGAFDRVISRYSAHHWPNPQNALREFRRILRPAGNLLLADVVSFDDFTADTHLQAIELLRDPSHVRDHAPGQWMTLLTVAGFQAEIAYRWELRLDFQSWVERMNTPATAVAAIRQLLDGAPDEVRRALKVEADHSFTVRCAILRGTIDGM
jgi:SAM-dependent methyltransferase